MPKCRRIDRLVDSEMTMGKSYSVILLAKDDHWDVSCTCEARTHKQPCKHKVAICFALLGLRDYYAIENTSPLFKRKLSRWMPKQSDKPKSLYNSIYANEARLQWKWNDIIQRMTSDQELHFKTAGGNKRKYNVVHANDESRKKKKKAAEKSFCYCGKDEEAGEWWNVQGRQDHIWGS